MLEFAAKHQRLARVLLAVLIALAWCFSAYVAFGSSPGDGTLARIVDLTLSAPAGALAVCKGVAIRSRGMPRPQ